MEAIIGEIYTHENGNVFCWGGRDALYYTGGGRIREKFFNEEGGNFHMDKCRPATEWERAWLLEMKRRGKYIPENQFELSHTYQIY